MPPEWAASSICGHTETIDLGITNDVFEKCTEYIRMRNPKAVIFPISAKTGEGIEAVADWLKEEVKNWKGV